MTVFLSHVVAQTAAHSYRLYMKALMCEIIGSAEIGLWMKTDNNIIVTVTTRRRN